jgi:RimK family alpha-L-glutamate ligase
MTTEVAILTHEFGWHGQQLTRAFADRGMRATWVPIQDCRLSTAGSGAGIHLPGFEDRLPDGVFVRGIPQGTLEAIVLCLDVLYALGYAGVPVYNHPAAIERSVDKGLTSWLLARDGIATPPAWAVRDRERAEAIRRDEEAAGHRLVLKPLFGSMGKGVRLLAPGEALPPAEALEGVYYLQRFIPPASPEGWCDWRVLVINDRTVGAMKRFGLSWINNHARGAACQAGVVSEAADGMARAAARSLGLDYAGVDLIQDPDGRFQVLEVNGIPAWRGLQSVLPEDLAGRLADGCRARWDPAPALEEV